MAKTDPKKQRILDKAISFFYCERNKDIENFIKNGSRGYDSTAIMLEEKGITRTYFLIDEDTFQKTNEILAYFSITLKQLEFTADVSNREIKKIDGISRNRSSIIVYLIAQLAKNDKYRREIRGEEIINRAINIIEKSQKLVGGRIIMVECENEDSLINFYEEHGFKNLQVNKNNGLRQLTRNHYDTC
jgi:predicted GNAT family N-acyltransferase